MSLPRAFMGKAYTNDLFGAISALYDTKFISSKKIYWCEMTPSGLKTIPRIYSVDIFMY